MKFTISQRRKSANGSLPYENDIFKALDLKITLSVSYQNLFDKNYKFSWRKSILWIYMAEQLLNEILW